MSVDAATVEAAMAGDAAAMAAIVDEFTPTVVGAAYGLCGDVQQAGDIAQEVFATMLVRLRDLRSPEALPGWLMAVTRSVARRQRKLVTAPLLPCEVEGPEDVVLARDAARRVRLVVEALPPDQRLPIVLHYFAGHRLVEIAELCDLPMSTVKKRMRVARARMRERIDMTQDVSKAVSPDPSDVIRMYTAMRSGDSERVERILDDRPDLVDAREEWTRADSFAHRLTWSRGGTPLLRAVERGDVGMVRLLLSRGADPDGACTCEGGESPLWVAVAQRETAIVEELLTRGADPNARAFAGKTPLDVARMRGFDELEETLSAAGAVVSDALSQLSDDAVVTEAAGIKAIDLWCPLPQAGLVHLTPGFGLGAVVLIAELSCRAARAGHPVVWTGFVQAPTDLRDVHHALADAGLLEVVELCMAPPSADADERTAALDRGIRVAGADAFLVVFNETGYLHAVEERLLTLAQRSVATLVVAPLDGSVTPPRPDGSPYLASIVFDVERARQGRWPAVGAQSWSKCGDPAMQDLARHARAHLSDALEDYLCQPFFVAEHVTGRPGEHVAAADLQSDVAALTGYPLD